MAVPYTYIAVYDNMRLGFPKYEKYLRKVAKFHRRVILPSGKYKLYDTGTYPVVVEDSSAKAPLMVDIFKIPNSVFEWLKMLEGAFDKTHIVIHCGEVFANMWVHDIKIPIPDTWSVIYSGDWPLYLAQKKSNYVL